MDLPTAIFLVTLFLYFSLVLHNFLVFPTKDDDDDDDFDGLDLAIIATCLYGLLLSYLAFGHVHWFLVFAGRFWLKYLSGKKFSKHRSWLKFYPIDLSSFSGPWAPSGPPWHPASLPRTSAPRDSAPP
jgi:hypothetical protein